MIKVNKYNLDCGEVHKLTRFGKSIRVGKVVQYSLFYYQSNRRHKGIHCRLIGVKGGEGYKNSILVFQISLAKKIW